MPCRRCTSDPVVALRSKLPLSQDDDIPHSQLTNDDNRPSLVDSRSRRQLLLSMLVAAGASSSITSNPAFASESDQSVVALTEEPSIANSVRSDGSTKLIIPPLDKRAYETLTLDNGLRILLCSDPSSNSAAAAMDVHVGAASDPDDVPGLAHFCEVRGMKTEEKNFYHRSIFVNARFFFIF